MKTSTPSESSSEASLSSAKIAAFIGSSLLAFSPIFVRLIDMGPMAIGFWRLLFSLPMIWIWRSWERTKGGFNPKLPAAAYGSMLLAGVFFGGDIALWNISLNHTSVANSSLFNNFAVFFIPIITWILYREKPAASFIGGAAIALLGSYLLTYSTESFNPGLGYGDVMAILAAACFAGYLMIVTAMRKTYPSTQILCWSSLGSAASLALMAASCEECFFPPSAKDLCLAGVLAFVVQIGAQGLLVVAVGRLSATHTSLLMFLAPIGSALLAYCLFEESMSLSNLLGGVMILGGIFWAQRRGRK